ncbi:MAG: ankyrin repeat domain-containing protein [Candidatus Buchananbacteria bacterium]|nr:ankyrin repeat domain-containing protein [Candidatus Buchananbacteria bacterium]
MASQKSYQEVTLNDLKGYFLGLNPGELSEIIIAEINKKNPNLKLLRFLMSRRNDLGGMPIINNFYFIPMALAISGGHLAVVTLLVEFSGINDYYFDRGTPLHLAAQHGQKDILQFFIDQGVNFDLKGLGGATPLHYAARSGHIEIVNLLLDLGADINSESAYSTPLYWAVMGNQVEAVKLLIERGADLAVIYHGFDGYGGENHNLVQAAITASFDISMPHEVSDKSWKIVDLLEKAGDQALTVK